MDSYRSFVDRFKRAVRTQDFEILPSIFKDGQRSLAIVSLEQRESAVCSILEDERYCVLLFLKSEIERQTKTNKQTNKSPDTAVKEAFHFLQFFVENFYTTPCFVRYIRKIKDVCQFALTVKCNLYIKKAACDVFTKLIELFEGNASLKLAKTIKTFTNIPYIKNFLRNERRLIFCVLAKIIKHNVGICLPQKCFNIFKQMKLDASYEYDFNTKVHTDFYMYFDSFADMLDSVEPPDNIKKEFYEWIKNFSHSSEQQRANKEKRTVMGSAIKLLNRHMNLFQDLLYPDYKSWHDTLRSLSLETTTYGVSGRHALKRFYRIIGQILTDQNSEKSDLKYFLDYFHTELKNTNLDLSTLRLVVYGFSQMAAPCKTHLDESNLRSMYSDITSYALPLCASEHSHSTHIENVCCYQEALSEILCHMTDVTIEKINVIVKLSIYTIKRFPDLTISNKVGVYTLTRTISNLATVNKGLLQRYLDTIVYDGVAWSCSHTLALDAELQRELNNLSQLPVCYKNYLPLWTELLNADNYRGHEELAQYVANTMLDVCIALINRLNIQVKRKNEDTVLSDVALTQSAVNQADFRVFANLVDLYVDVIDASELQFGNTVHRFLYEVVRLSYRYPLISGFYKLIRTGMKILAHISEEEEEEKNAELQRTKELLSNYLCHTLDLIPAFSNELLIACLYLILDAPFAYIEDALSRTLPAFKIAFTVGLSNLELAYTALATLETWTTSTTAQKRERDERTNELLREIVAYLEPYLRSTESSVELSQDLTTARKRVKRVDVIDTECTLRNFQRRVLLFLGSLDHDLLMSFVHERASRSTGASWDHKNLLKYNLSLPDARPVIYFDRMLPRIIALARDSSDRRTKIAACEVLHSMVTLFLGSTARYLGPKNPYAALHGTLCRAVVALGCDPDEVVYGLFHPLAMQLMRWLSSRSTSMSLVIDALFDGLTDDSNPALREFSGMCLAEFTRQASSISTSSDTRTISHVSQIIGRINNLALHPSTRKRVAAAVAFNHLYVILREDDDTVSIYWLEIFYCFVRSLDGCNDPSITNALSHIERVMKPKLKADLLNTAGVLKRRKPHEFDDATLISALYWLLSQCGTVDEHCRAKCMELYVNLSQYVGSCAQKMTQNFVETHGINRLNDIILKGLESGVKDTSTTDNVTSLLKALDCYVWLIDKKLLSVEMLFPTDDVEQTIFLCIRSFARQFCRVIAVPSAGTSETTMKSRELEQLQALQCKALMTTFNFIQVLLNIDINVLRESLWDDSLSELTIRCIMHPRAVGFDMKNIEMTDKLPHILEALLNSMRSRYNYALPGIFKKHLLSFVREHITKLLNLCNVAQNDFCDDLIQHVKGLILLKRCDMLDPTVLETSAFTNGDNVVERIFKFLVSERIGELVCKDLRARMIEYLRTLMEFQFSLLSSTIENPLIIGEDTRSMTEKLVQWISNNAPVTSVDCTIITHGEHFLNTFKSVIFKFMLTNVGAMKHIFDTSRDDPSFLLKWTEDLLLFLKRHRRELQVDIDAILNVILQQFSYLNNAVCNVNSRKERLMNIYSIVVHLKSKPTEIMQNQEFYQWIRNELINNNLEYKTKILKNFFICLTDVTDVDRQNLQRSLRTLKDDGRLLCSNLSETNVNAMKVIDCFETLLVLLSTTRSIIMLECVIHFAAGTGKRLFENEKLEEHLHGYYEATFEHVLESLQQTYNAFMDMNTPENERLDILNKFLLPAFKFCDAIAIERFFEKNIQDLIKIADLRIVDNDDAIKQIIVSKIGYFQLVAVMFARVGEDKIDANDKIEEDAIAQNNQFLINKDLYKKLNNDALNIRSLRITRPDCKEFTRLLHCSAYNCWLAIVSLKKEERFYGAAFGESAERKLWQNIIDCDTQYQLGQIFEEYPNTREITVNIKSAEDRDGQRTHRYAYVHSYDLSSCTLSEDINAYDFNKCVVLPSDFRRHASTTNSIDSDPLRAHGATSIALQSSDFNEHECMPYICVLLRHIRKTFGLSNDKHLQKPPEWLNRFLRGLNSKNNKNIQLFILQVISNTADEVFKPYARAVLGLSTMERIIRAIADYLERYDLNYIITDVLEILLNWDDVTVLSTENDKKETQRLFKVFVEKVLRANNNRRVYDYNLNLMKIMVEKWRSCLRVPEEVLKRKMISSPAAAVYLILVLLNNGMEEEIVTGNDIVDFLLRPLSDRNTDETPLQCCECLGLYLRSLDNGRCNETERESKKREVKDKIFAILGSVSANITEVYMTKQVKRVAVLCRTYPEVAKDYINVTINAMAKCLERAYCLEIFALAMWKMSAEEIVNNLCHMELQRILMNRESSCEKIALQIVRDMVAIVSPTNLLPYVELTLPYIKDNITEHRELVYDILMRIHKRYSADIADDDATVRNLLSVSVQNLLAGLLDPSSDLQDRILKFWTEETSLDTNSSKERLIALLAMHSSQMTTNEDAFAPFVTLLMLQLATKSIDYNRKMFDEPLQNNCEFKEHKITVSWRRRNLSCVTPMFVDSLASQMSYSTFSQSVDNDLYGTYTTLTFSHSRFSNRVPARLRATQDLQFTPTFLEDDDAADVATTLDISSDDTGFDRGSIASSSRRPPQTGHERFTRILANTSDVSNIIRNQQILKNVERAEKIKQESIRQRSSVKLYRNYRIGYFPDIEISHASLIVPLQQLIKLDRLICKDVTVSLFYSLIGEVIERERRDDFRRTIVESLKRILHDSCERDSSFNAVVLETLLRLSRDAPTVADCDPRDIVKTSKANHLNALGTLLLELSLLPDARDDDSGPTSSKRMRRHDDDIRNEETMKWTQLASLYKSLNDVDVVLSIFRGRQAFGQNVQEAALAEVDGDWIRAKDAFASAYEQTEDPSIKEHCLQGLLEAANNLCDWSAIDRLVKGRAENGNLSDIWNDAWKDWMIPYACDAYVHMLENRDWASNSNDMRTIQSWTGDQNKLQHLMPATGENLVIFLLKTDDRSVKKATDLLNDLLDMTGKQWVGLNPLSTELGIRKLFKLQVMNDLDASLKVLRCANRKDKMTTLLNFWSRKTPTIRDNLIQWNKLAAYRAYSSMLFQDDCRRRKNKKLYQNNYQLRLNIIDAALSQKHRYIAEEHLKHANKYLNYISEMVGEEDDVRRPKLSLAWLQARIKCLCADVEMDVSKKMNYYTASWESSHELLKSEELDPDTSTAIKEHIGTMASKIESLSRENDAFASTLASNTILHKDIGTTSTDLDDIREHLLSYSLNKLQSCCENPTIASVGEHYCALARHCYSRLMSTDAENDEIFQKFMSSTLRSMSHDYLEATHYFPCLLRSKRLQNDETRARFVQECAKLRPWLFLRWRDLLFSHLGTASISTAIISIVERLAQSYPDAIAYTYHLTVERNPGILQDEKVQRIRSLLRDKAEEYERFLRAIEYVAQPKLYLKHYLDEAMRDLSRGKATAIESLLRKVYPNSSVAEGKNPRPGVIFNKEIADYECEIRALDPNNRDTARDGIRRLKERLNKSFRKSTRYESKLKDYSPFLHEYVGRSGGGIEIPGQYTGDREPVPRYHVRIARFEPQVEVMQSLRKPIRIGMMGDNGREYKFLVKFGEDLTIDRGLQQLYSTMNRTLRNDPGCRQRRLAIDTYEVIPLSSSFGLIQWIEDTKSLDDLVKFTLSNNEKNRLTEICIRYAKWIKDAAPTKQRITDRYKVSLSKYSQQEVTEYMKRLISKTRPTALRDAFNMISPSPECFVTLRRNFVASYATMCAAHWLAGIGDRHLQNTLVHIATGRCLGIDFGHAFGSGVRAPIPELVPFRLTPQILELLRPFTERDLLATIMTHTMRALRDDRGPILACMDIFVHKPVHRSLSINDGEITRNDDEDIDADLTWSSKRNIEIVAKKLNGIHPSVITLEQLKEAHDDDYFARYHAIVTGNDGLKRPRADVRSDRLTPAEQVDCLLDQAKDLNILGRMYEKWQSWL
ncbi:DNA-dependent protein kinase catalytic subunit isoform X2 [Temnothorax americanus]|uniref:DNA-dependent protein kinase catalytic subunit isoform X2 n=1 Tax=Temnothorax americanus TaxID=1964332 RepID=UPI004068C0C7